MTFFIVRHQKLRPEAVRNTGTFSQGIVAEGSQYRQGKFAMPSGFKGPLDGTQDAANCRDQVPMLRPYKEINQLPRQRDKAWSRQSATRETWSISWTS
jgi:hypothetical protein